MTSKVDKNATNPCSNPLRFHRVVILGKLIPVDDFSNLLVKNNTHFNGLPSCNI